MECPLSSGIENYEDKSRLTIHRFLLARIYLGLLYDKLTSNDIRSTLELFRNQDRGQDEDGKIQLLEHAYSQAMNRINGQAPGFKELATGVLPWVSRAKRPLKTSELQHALATKTGKSKLDHGDSARYQRYDTLHCAGLVTIDEESDIVRLVHYTTQEYLERTMYSRYPHAESAIARICIHYLSFGVFQMGHCKTDDEFEERLRSNPLYDYAACNWGHHAKDMKASQEVIDFLESKTKVEASSQAMTVAVKRGLRHLNYSQAFPREMTGLHLAGYFGIANAVELLILKHNPDLRDSYGRTPLTLAAQNNNKAVVQLLIDTKKGRR